MFLEKLDNTLLKLRKKQGYFNKINCHLININYLDLCEKIINISHFEKKKNYF